MVSKYEVEIDMPESFDCEMLRLALIGMMVRVKRVSALDKTEKEPEQIGKVFPVSECCRAGAAKVKGITDHEYYVCSNCGHACTLTEWSKPKLQKCAICGKKQPYVAQASVCLGCLKPSLKVEELPPNLDLECLYGKARLVRGTINQILDYLRAKGGD